MKSHWNRTNRQTGSVLLVTLFIASLIGIFLGSYLILVKQQKTLTARSQAWNGAFAVAEAGVEEALAQLNPGAPLPWIDKSANGWGGPAAGVYGPVTRSVSGGSYTVAFTTNNWPIIYSTGYVTVPALSAQLTRVIRVATTNVPLFNVLIAAKGGINMLGNNVTTDSFDSGLSSLSTNQRYDSTKVSTNGDIASMGGVVSVGNANVKGTVYLGPSADSSIKNNGYISGGVENDFNFDFPNVKLPQTTWLPAALTNVTINGVNYNYVFTTSTGDYQINNLSGSVYVGTNSHIRLRLTGSANPSQIRVAGPGSEAGSLAIYMDGPSFSLTGSSVVDGAIAANLSLLGTTNCTSISFSGNTSFTGTIYAPQANFTLGGGGSSTYDFVGAIIANTMSVNGHFNFHFDEALLRSGPLAGYTANSWREL